MKSPLQPDAHTDKASDLLLRFQKQLDKVEELMNASMRPLIHQKSLLSEEAGRQALETLERWSELYRHGLEASALIAERGEAWLREAYQRLDLTVEELQKLDIRNEALATRERADKASYLLTTIDKIKHLILPIVEQVKSPVADTA